MTKTCGCGATIGPKNRSGNCHACAMKIAPTPRKGPLKAPADFAEHAARETNTELMGRYDRSDYMITRWRKETGTPSPYACVAGRSLNIPRGFRLVAPEMTKTELKERYEVSEPTIDRWCKATGIKARVPRAAVGSTTRKLAPIGRPSLDMSRAAQAATHLQRFGEVLRCDAAGRIDPRGTHWRRNGFVLTGDDIIARAIRNGWNPDAWKELAAA